MDNTIVVATRAQALRKGPLSYIDAFLQALPDLFDPTCNPQGAIACVVAENKNNVLQERFLTRLEEVPSPDLGVMNYGSMTGSPALQRALCELLKRTFAGSPTVSFNPNNMAVLSGCTACIDNLAFCLMDEGAGVLLPTPTYAAFDNDLKARAHLRPVDFELDEAGGEIDIERQLNEAVEAARTKGIIIRALLITNPSNPLGIIYSNLTIKVMLRWAMENSIHYIADEIYALSVHAPGVEFKSSMSILYEDLVETGLIAADVAQSYFHLLYGLSKDWCASGLRIGCLYSDNAALQQALSSLAPMGSVSNYVQHKVANVLQDEDFTETFVADNASSLRQSYELLTAGLRRLNIPFQEAQAGIFCWVDLRAWMGEQTFAEEDKLWRRLLSLKIIWTPGRACHSIIPGFFRVCFAWVDNSALSTMLTRLEEGLQLAHL